MEKGDHVAPEVCCDMKYFFPIYITDSLDFGYTDTKDLKQVNHFYSATIGLRFALQQNWHFIFFHISTAATFFCIFHSHLTHCKWQLMYFLPYIYCIRMAKRPPERQYVNIMSAVRRLHMISKFTVCCHSITHRSCINMGQVSMAIIHLL